MAIKKLSNPFGSSECAKKTYRELLLLEQVKHENVSRVTAQPIN